MTLGTFQPRARVTGDKLNLQQYAGRPLLVRTTEYVPDFSSQAYPNPKPVVFADVVDLISGTIFINVLWGAGAVVDNLKDKAGTEEVVPVKPGNQVSATSGRTYITLYPLEGKELDAAVGWYNTSWAVVDQTRLQRQQQAAAAAPAQGQFQQSQAQAPATQYAPVQGYGQPQSPVQDTVQPGAYAQPPTTPQGYGQPQPQAASFQPQQPPVQYAGQPAPQFGQPQAQPMQYAQPQAPQGFGAPQGGVFSDVPPGPPAGAPVAQFAPPQGQDPAVATAALAHLNQQAGQQPQG